jgi:hypothetical protein
LRYHGRRTATITEDLGNSLVALAVDLDRVAHVGHREKLHDVAVPEPDAPVGGGFPDGIRAVRAMNPISLFVQSQPPLA